MVPLTEHCVRDHLTTYKAPSGARALRPVQQRHSNDKSRASQQSWYGDVETLAVSLLCVVAAAVPLTKPHPRSADVQHPLSSPRERACVKGGSRREVVCRPVVLAAALQDTGARSAALTCDAGGPHKIDFPVLAARACPLARS